MSLYCLSISQKGLANYNLYICFQLHMYICFTQRPNVFGIGVVCSCHLNQKEVKDEQKQKKLN